MIALFGGAQSCSQCSEDPPLTLSPHGERGDKNEILSLAGGEEEASKGNSSPPVGERMKVRGA
jgi:hypothetical protein